MPATVLDLGGAPADGISGISLMPAVRGDALFQGGNVYIRAPRRAALVEWPLKLLVIERKRSDRVLLFDLAADPA